MPMKNKVWRGIIEVGLIIFLLYSTLLMREMEFTATGHDKGLFWDLYDIVTLQNFTIALLAGLIGYVFVEHLRDRPASADGSKSNLKRP